METERVGKTRGDSEKHRHRARLTEKGKTEDNEEETEAGAPS